MRQGGAWWRARGRLREAERQVEPLLAPGDGWSEQAAALPQAGAEQVSALRRVLAPDPGARPAQRPDWLWQVHALTRREHRAAYAALRALFGALGTAVPLAGRGEEGDGRPLLVCLANVAAAVNLVWAAVELLGEQAAPMLGLILDRTLTEPWTVESGRLRNACTHALVELDSPMATAMLVDAAASAPTKAQKEQLLLCLDLVRHRKDQPPSRVAELHVPDHGLNGNGRLLLRARHREYELSLLPDGRVAAEDRSADTTPDQAAQRVLEAQVRSIRATYRKERMRIEALLATERSWGYDEWRRLYQDNPITRTVACRLVWRHEFADGSVLEVLPDPDGGAMYTRQNGVCRSSHTDAPSSTVSLWHPRDAEPASLAAWRALREDRGLVQPFEQIDRDFTRVEPDPDAMELNRWSAVEVDAEAFEDTVPRLGWHSHRSRAGRSSDAVRLILRDFPDARLGVAVAWREQDGTVVLGSGWFHRAEDRARTPLALGYVPPRVHSEALRDLAVLARGARPGEDDVHDLAGY